MANGAVTERRVALSGVSPEVLSIEYLTSGEGPPLLLLHGLGDSAHTWQWAMSALGRTHHVYAPTLPGFGASSKPTVEYSSAFFTDSISAFLDTLGLEQVHVVGNSLGGLIAMHLALKEPARVTSLGLVASAGLGPELNLSMRMLTLPGLGKVVTYWNKTVIGAWQWSLLMTVMLFAHPYYAPRAWVVEVYRMARMTGYLEATIATLRSISTFRGQRQNEILLDSLPRLTMPTLVVWGDRDRVLPARHGRAAMERLVKGQLELIHGCGHLPQIEHANRFADILNRFLTAPPP